MFTCRGVLAAVWCAVAAGKRLSRDVANSDLNVEAASLQEPAMARWVRILQKNTDCLQVAYLDVLNPSGQPIARGKAASSTGGLNGVSPSLAVTGDPGVRSHPAAYHSACTGANEWWQVDLGSLMPVARVYYYNRVDCCANRAAGAEVQLLGASGAVLVARQLNGDMVQTIEFGSMMTPTPLMAPTTVRYVRMLQKTAACLQVSYLDVLDASGQPVARGKATTSSGGFADASGNPSLAVTGDPGPRNHPGEFVATCKAANEWWMVDLGGPTTVARVYYYNRMDCCANRAAWAEVQLLNINFAVLSTKPLNADLVQTLEFGPMAAPAPVNVLMNVRYVRVLQKSTECLQVAFLDVLDPSGQPIARGKVATSSGVRPDSSGNPALAVTGEPGVRPHPAAYHAECLAANEWWMVDLGGTAAVARVVYYNRQDCCQPRAAGAEIQLLSATLAVLATRPLTGDFIQTLDFLPTTTTLAATVSPQLTVTTSIGATTTPPPTTTTVRATTAAPTQTTTTTTTTTKTAITFTTTSTSTTTSSIVVCGVLSTSTELQEVGGKVYINSFTPETALNLFTRGSSRETTRFISATLRGTGIATLAVGNSNNATSGNNWVKVLLNSDTVATVQGIRPLQDVTVPFSDGDVLRVQQDGGLMLLGRLNFVCPGIA